MQPKNSLKFKLLAFWKKLTLFIDQKCTSWKGANNFGQGPPPPYLGNARNNAFSPPDTVPIDHLYFTTQMAQKYSTAMLA